MLPSVYVVARIAAPLSRLRKLLDTIEHSARACGHVSNAERAGLARTQLELVYLELQRVEAEIASLHVRVAERNGKELQP